MFLQQVILKAFGNIVTILVVNAVETDADMYVCFAVLGWQNTCESAEDIKATLVALNTDIDISVLYRGLDPKNKHSLVSVVCC